LKNEALKLLVVADGESLQAVNGTGFSRTKWNAYAGAASEVASSFKGNNRHPLRMRWIPRGACIPSKVNDDNRRKGGTFWVIPPRGI
jgi:hypothetical protein